MADTAAKIAAINSNPIHLSSMTFKPNNPVVNKESYSLRLNKIVLLGR